MTALIGMIVLALSATGCGGGSGDESRSTSAPDVASRFGTQYEKTGSGPMVDATVPQTPGVKTLMGRKQGNTRSYELTAGQSTQQIASFPLKTAKIWGYNGGTPGPTLIAYEGERVRVTVTNKLPPTQLKPSMPATPTMTTVHFHGMHEPNTADGVAGISQPDPIRPGASHTYDFVPGHVGTFAYHSHTDGPVQELRGLDGFFIILPKKERTSVRVDKDYAMVLQQFAPPGEGKLVAPFPPATGDFPFSTINGKTGDASGGPITIDKGDRVRIRLYNASNLNHSMHLHGHDMVLVSKNGHAVPPLRETTQDVAPGDFFDVVFTANNPGNWIFHCHVPHHTANKMMPGYNGSPVGMTRIFHYRGYAIVPPQYFGFAGKS